MARVGRNEPCPCGTGKKYKRCCLPRDEAIELEARRNERTAQLLSDILDDLDERSNSIVDLINGGDLDEAERRAESLLKEYPDVHDGLERLAMVAEARGDLEKALHFYGRTLEFISTRDGYDDGALEYIRKKIAALSAKNAT